MYIFHELICFELKSPVASNWRSSILFVLSKMLDDLSHVCFLSAMEVAIALDAASAVCCAATLCCFASVDASVFILTSSVLTVSSAVWSMGKTLSHTCL